MYVLRLFVSVVSSVSVGFFTGMFLGSLLPGFYWPSLISLVIVLIVTIGMFTLLLTDWVWQK